MARRVFLAAATAAVAMFLPGCGGASGTPQPATSPEWVADLGGTGQAASVGVGVLSDGGVAVAGVHDGDVVFNRGTPDEMRSPGTGRTCTFVARMDASGAVRWHLCFSGSEYVRAMGTAVLPGDDLVVGGFFTGWTPLDSEDGANADLHASGLEDGFLARFDAAGNLRWARAIGGADSWDEILGVAGLPDGTVAVAGLFTGHATFGAGEPNETTLVTDMLEAFVARFDADGALLWARQTASVPGAYATGWAVTGLSDGSVVAAGELAGTTTFGVAEATATTLTSSGSEDTWVARFGPTGDLAWARRVGGTDEVEVLSLATAPGDAVFATGYFRGTAAADADGPAPAPLTAAGALDAFLVAFEPDGTVRYAHAFGGLADDLGLDVVALPDGSALLAGRLVGAAGLDGDVVGQSLLGVDETGGSADAFVAHFAPDGVLGATRAFGGAAMDMATAVGFDPASATVFLGGSFAGPASFAPPTSTPATPLTPAGAIDAFVGRFVVTGVR